MIRKRSTSHLFVCVLLAMLLIVSACSNAQPPSPAKPQAGDSSQQSDQPVSMTFYASPGANINDLKTNWFTKYVEDNFKINIKWMIVPKSDVATKQPLLLASGDYPEVFWNGSFKPTDVLKYSKQGIFVPLNKYLKEYAPNVMKAIDTAPGLKEIAVAPDGNIYGLPTYNWCDHCFWGAKYWINTKLLAQYNLQMPTTTEEFEKVLQVFKDNGLIPLTGSKELANNPTVFLMNAFSYNNRVNYFHFDQGKLIFSPASQEWKQGLAYMASLHAKGLLDKQALSQDVDAMKRLVSQNKVGVVPALASNSFIEGGSANPDYAGWRTVPPLKGPSGKQYAAFFGNGYSALSFTMTNKASEEQKIAMAKLLNFIYSKDGTQILNFGAEGKFWSKPKPGAKTDDGTDAIFDTSWNKFYSADSRQNDGWDQMGPIFQSKEWRRGQVAYPITSADGLSSMLRMETEKNYAGKQPKEVVPATLWVTEEDNQQFAMYQTNINKFVEQWSAEFIAGIKSTDKDWDAYIKGLEGLGLPKYLEMTNKVVSKPFDTSSFQKAPGVVEFVESLK